MVALIANAVANHERHSKYKQCDHNHSTYKNCECPSQKMGLKGTARRINILGGESGTPQDFSGCQRRDGVIKNGQHAKVVVCTGNQVLEQEPVTGGG